MENELISIIIPMYNTEQYIECCLDSIRRQTYKNLEVIMIDDGSTDNVATICKKYCNKDSRFRYFYKQNEGVSIARNMGLEIANGDIIAFVDSDDYIKENMIENMVSKMEKEKSDIVICDAVNIQFNGSNNVDTINLFSQNESLTKEQITPDILSEIAGAVWRCIYRKQIIKDLIFPQGLKLSEDCIFNICAMGNARKISYLKEGLYIRVCRPGSAVYSFHEDRFLINLSAYKIMCQSINKYWSDVYLKLYKEKFILNCLATIDELCSFRIKKKILYRYNKIKFICLNEDVEQLTGYVRTNRYLSNLKIKMINRKNIIGLLILSTIVNLIKQRRDI